MNAPFPCEGRPITAATRLATPALPPSPPATGGPAADAATTTPAATSDARPRHRVRLGTLFFVVFSAAAGAAIVWRVGFQHRCVAILRVAGDGSPNDGGRYRRELLDYAWNQLTPANDGRVDGPIWSVEWPSPTTLHLELRSADRAAGLASIRSVAERFCAHMDRVAELQRTIPGDAERALQKSAADLRKALDESQAEFDSAMASLPAGDSSAAQPELMARWDELRPRITAVRGEFAATTQGVAELRAEPEPTRGVVAADARQSALLADGALQQDLKELAVNLTELKLHMLNVWQRASASLDRLRGQIDDLITTASGAPPSVQPGAAVGDFDSFRTAATEYRSLLVTFVESWTARFTELKQIEVDPTDGAILDGFTRIRQLVDDFTFRAGKQLAAMRPVIDALRVNPVDEARQHVFLSNMVRDFQTLQTLHHQFEFLAGTLETGENFRLDSALRGARGLRRRTLERTREIDERLEAEAARVARERRQAELVDGERRAAGLREATDAAIDQMLALQESLNLAAGRSEAEREQATRVRVASARLATYRAELEQVEDRLRQQAADRTAAAGWSRVSLVSCEAVGPPANLLSSMGLGVSGGLATLLIASLIRRLVTRSSPLPA